MDLKNKGKIEYPLRINRYLALKGICSRREADQFIKEGKISLNGKAARIGDKVQAGDEVKVSKPLGKEYVYLAYNKAPGIITHSPQGRERSIEDVLKYSPKVFPVGRLDKDSRGLILLTNDGRLTGRILEPEHEHEKEYLVEVDRTVSEHFIKELSGGVRLDDGYLTKPCRAGKKGEKLFSIVLTEGKKRQIRRMCQMLGYQVTDLRRIRILNIELGDLPSGQYRKLEGKELKCFLEKIGLE